MATQYSCLEKLHGQGSLAGYSLRGCKESDMTEYIQTVYEHIIWNQYTSHSVINLY